MFLCTHTIWYTHTLPFTRPHTNKFVEHFPGYNLIYTDGSLSGSKAASAAMLGDKDFALRLPDMSSIFTAEMYALLISFQQIEKKHQEAFYYFFRIQNRLYRPFS